MIPNPLLGQGRPFVQGGAGGGGGGSCLLQRLSPVGEQGTPFTGWEEAISCLVLAHARHGAQGRGSERAACWEVGSSHAMQTLSYRPGSCAA